MPAGLSLYGSLAVGLSHCTVHGTSGYAPVVADCLGVPIVALASAVYNAVVHSPDSLFRGSLIQGLVFVGLMSSVGLGCVARPLD